jgi:hypothetical protein
MIGDQVLYLNVWNMVTEIANAMIQNPSQIWNVKNGPEPVFYRFSVST